MENSSAVYDAVFHALSDPTRRAVIARLTVRHTSTVTELAAPFPIGMPTFLKHLRVLERSGLVRTKKVGRVRSCTLQPKRLREAEAWLSKRREQMERRLDAFAAYVESLTPAKDAR
jgi:DNA-binding transcriptional ArsR family regulator